MKRMVFSVKVERTPYQGRYYMGAWTALGRESCEAPGARCGCTYASSDRVSPSRQLPGAIGFHKDRVSSRRSEPFVRVIIPCAGGFAFSVLAAVRHNRIATSRFPSRRSQGLLITEIPASRNLGTEVGTRKRRFFGGPAASYIVISYLILHFK